VVVPSLHGNRLRWRIPRSSTRVWSQEAHHEPEFPEM